jgi:ferrous iron transport protein B
MSENLNIALVGNPNVGKTSVFNLLAGVNQHVGNWPGVTVEKKEGTLSYDDMKFNLVDLPGIYDFSSLSEDERISRDYILFNQPDLVVYIADATRLARSLYLGVQILEMQVPTVLVINKIDLAEKKGIQINMEELSRILGIPVVATNSRKNQGLDELKELLAGIKPEKPPVTFRYYDEYENRFLEDQIQTISRIIPEGYSSEKKRYLAIQLIEGDSEITKDLFPESAPPEIETSREAVRSRFDLEPDVIFTEKRYAYSQGIAKEVIKNTLSTERKLDISDKLDRIFTNKYLGIPIFLGIMWLLFQAVFTLGNPLVDFLDGGVGALSGSLESMLGKTFFSSLLIDGILGGVGSVAVLLPNILIMFLFMAILEDSGYMARAAFVMDGFMHRLGLHGKSFIPMLLGFGCSVPAIMATRTIESKKDRILTVLIAPFMSCSARLPVYVLFTGIFFQKNEGMVVFYLYVLGIVVAILSANLFKKLFFKGERFPLIMELPFYQLPSLKKLAFHMWERSRIYLKKAGTIILAGSVIIWFLASFPVGVAYGSSESWIGSLGKIMAPAFGPAGFGYWQAAVALLFGIVAKETVVSTLGTLFAAYGTINTALPQFFTPLSAYAFLVMTLLYVPCLATVGVMKQEAGTKWTVFGTLYSLVVGWLGAVLVYQGGMFLF